jgi:hypothetical protein
MASIMQTIDEFSYAAWTAQAGEQFMRTTPA